MKRDRFEEILQDRLRDFELEPSEKDWAALARELGIPARKRVPLVRYATAAAVLVAGVLGVTLFLTDPARPGVEETTVAEETGSVARTPVDGAKGSLPEGETGSAVEAVVRLKEAIEKSRRGERQRQEWLAAATETEGTEKEELSPTVVPEEAGGNGETAAAESASRNRTATPGGNASSGFRPSPAGERSARAVETAGRDTRRTDGGWGLSLFAGGRTKLGGGSNAPGGPLIQSSPSVHTGIVEYDMSKVSALAVKETEYDHRFPLSFGLTVRKRLGARWGVETGLVYTYLSSKAEMEGTYRYKVKQQLHYLGVPVAFTYTPYRTQRFEFYLRAGATADFNIGGKRTTDIVSASGNGTTATERFRTESVQWSASGNAGIMYNVSPTVGFYFEPGVGYYFENTHQAESYWTENPWNFNMRLGIRTNF